MKRRSLSATSIKSFLECSKKFYFNYYTSKSKIFRGDALPFGIAVHEALETMYESLSKKEGKPTQDDYKYVLESFRKSAVARGLSDLGLYEEGELLLTKRLDSYDPSEKVLALELRFGYPSEDPKIPAATEKGTPLTGAIDKIIELDKDTLVIFDYKTSKFAMTEQEAATDMQISMYDLVVSKIYPQYKNIVVVMDYLRLDPVITHRTEQQRALFENVCDAIYEKLGNMVESDFRPTMNDFCGWCDYKKYCGAYCKSISDSDLKREPLETLDNRAFVEEWLRTSRIKKSIEDHHRSLKMHLEERLQRESSADLDGETHSLYKVQKGNVKYDTKTAYKLMPLDDFLGAVNVKKVAMDKFLVNNPEVAKEATDTAVKSFSRPYFLSRKIK